MADISKEELQKEIKKILSKANLNKTTAKNVRQQLEKRLGVDLMKQRVLIDKLVMDAVNNKEKEEEKEKKKPAKPVKKRKQSTEEESDDDDASDSDSDKCWSCNELEDELPDLSQYSGKVWLDIDVVNQARRRQALKSMAAVTGRKACSQATKVCSKKKKTAAKKKRAAKKDDDSDKQNKKNKKPAKGKKLTILTYSQ